MNWRNWTHWMNWTGWMTWTGWTAADAATLDGTGRLPQMSSGSRRHEKKRAARMGRPFLLIDNQVLITSLP
jgi:hypothetical protein